MPRVVDGHVSHRIQRPPLRHDREWDHDAAEARVRRWAKAQDGPNTKYHGAHVWYDPDSKDEFGAYKLLIAM